ncbi:MAG TPA: trehalose-6-phosphate synthase [Oculatellaceae cyanobacterium]|jgi:trehalose 6-phosphate synthase/phosphatase
MLTVPSLLTFGASLSSPRPVTRTTNTTSALPAIKTLTRDTVSFRGNSESNRPISGRLLILANRESHTLKHKPDSDDQVELSRSMGGLVTALMPLLQEGDFWISSRDKSRKDVPASKIREVVQERYPHLLDKVPAYNTVDIELSKEQINGHYNKISNGQLWPFAHDRIDTTERYRDSDWEKYREVNRAFAEKTLEHARDEDFIWVHDYQLMLAPGMIRERSPHKKIAYFHHIPFTDMNKHFPQKTELLRGLLGADLIGFHVPSYVENFLQAVEHNIPEAKIYTSKQVPGATIEYQGRFIRVQDFPISIDAQGLANRIEHSKSIQDYRQKWETFKRTHGIEYLGAGVERLDYSKGIPQRLEAIDTFLTKHPEYKKRFSFVQVTAPSRPEIPAYQALARDIRQQIERINEKHGTLGWKPIIQVAGMPNDEVMGLFQASDFSIVNSQADGMNLVAKEYVVAQGTKQARGGILIASPFMGVTEQWRNQTRAWEKRATLNQLPAPQDFWIPPLDIDATAEAIHRALRLSPAQRQKVMEPVRQHTFEHNVTRWSRDFLRAFQEAARHPHEGTPNGSSHAPHLLNSAG